MKKLLFSIIILSSLFSCKKNGIDAPQGEIIGVKEITVSIELPVGSTLNTNDLKVSTLLTDQSSVENSKSKVTTFDADAMEMAFATNSQGNMVLMGYFNPLDGETIKLNSTTTALALVMMHPWSVDLSVLAKTEALDYITTLPEYDALKSSIEKGIKGGEIDPLASTDVINKLILTQNRIIYTTSIYKEPLKFEIDKSKIAVENKYSSASYCVGLYTHDNKLVEKKSVDGLEKSFFVLREFFDIKFSYTTSPKIEFNTPQVDGDYYLRAKSGLSFDGSAENREAAFKNTVILLRNIIGLISTATKEILTKMNENCISLVGEFVYNGSVDASLTVAQSIKSFSENKRSGYLLSKDIILFARDRYESMVNTIEGCSKNVYNIKHLPFQKLFKYLDLLTRIQNAFDGGAQLADWLQYDKEINVCYTKDKNETYLCDFLIGKWKWTSMAIFGNPVFLKRCVLDDIYSFQSGGVYQIDEGPSKCQTTDPQIETGTYETNADKTKVTFKINGDPETYFIRKLTATTLELENEIPSKGEYLIYSR